MVRRKKVLFFIESLSGGGAEKVLTDLVANIDRELFEITVCAFVGKGTYVPSIKRHCNYMEVLPDPDQLHGLKRLIFKLKYKLFRKLPAKWLYPFIFKNEFDTEVAFIEGFCTKIIGASNNASSKKIAWVHLDLFKNHYTKKVFSTPDQEVRTYCKFDKIVCVSENVKEAFEKRFGSFRSLEVRYNPINSNQIKLKAKQVENGIPACHKKEFNFIAIGRLEPQKRFDRLVCIADQLKSEGFSFQITILGEGSLREELLSLIRKQNLEEVVILKGFCKNPFPLLYTADALLCSSITEGYSTVVSEALILGVPVITTDCAGMHELLGDNEYGIITENSTSALIQGIKWFMMDNSLQSTLREKSKERGLKFNLDQIIREVTTVL